MGCLEVYATPLGSQKQHLLRWQRLSERNWLELSGLVLQEVKHGEIELKNLRKASTSGIYKEDERLYSNLALPKWCSITVSLCDIFSIEWLYFYIIKVKVEKNPKLKDFNLRSQKSSTLPLHLGHWKSLAFRICPRQVLAMKMDEKVGCVGSVGIKVISQAWSVPSCSSLGCSFGGWPQQDTATSDRF